MIVSFLSGCVSDRGHLDAPIEHPHVPDRPPDAKGESPKFQTPASKVEEVTQLRTELTEIRMEFTTEIMKLRTEFTMENMKLRTEVTDLRRENTALGGKINELRTDIKVRLYWYPN